MTLDDIKAERLKIKLIAKTDPNEAQELFNFLSQKVQTYIAQNQLPSIWESFLLKALTE